MTPLFSRRIPIGIVGAALVVTLLTALAAQFYVSFRREQAASVVQANLEAVAHLKVDQLMRWKSERLGDGRYLSRNPLLADQVRQLLRPPQTDASRDRIKRWMVSLLSSYKYASAILVDPAGQMIVATHPGDRIGSGAREGLRASTESNDAVLTNLRRWRDSTEIRLNLIVPLWTDADPVKPMIAQLVLRIDPENMLIPILDVWPTPSQTSEAYLVDLEGDSIRYLTPLRFVEHPRLERKRALADMSPEAADAFRRSGGYAESIDYRGRRVAAAIQPIAGTSWHLIAKTDVEEVYAPLQRELMTAGVAAVALIVALLTTIGLWWRSRRVEYFRSQLIAEQDREAAERRFRLVVAAAPIGMHFYELDDQARLLFAGSNAAADRMLRRDLGTTVGVPLEEALPEFSNLPLQEQCRAIALGRESDHRFELTIRSGSTDATYDITVFQSGPRSITITFSDITQRRNAEERIRTSEERYRLLAENTNDVIWVLDARSLRFTYVSPSMERNFGYTAEEVRRSTLTDLLTPEAYAYLRDQVPRRIEAMQRSADAPSTFVDELQQVHRDGRPLWIEVSSRFLRQPDGAIHILGVTRIIEARKQSEHQLGEMNRLYNFISQINQLIVHTRDRDTLLAGACRIAVEVGQFKLAWIGWVGAQHTITPVAWAGVEDNYLAQLRITSLDEPAGRGPTGTAAREGRPCIVNDLATADLEHMPWRDDGLRRGFRSAIGLPLVVRGSVSGVLTVLSGETNYFAAEEVELLTHVTGDLAYAIEGIENETVRRQKEAELLLKEVVFETSIAANSIADLQGNLVQMNAAALRAWGYKDPAEVIGKSIRNLVQSAQQADDIAASVEEHDQWIGEFTAVRKDGSTFDAFAVATVIRDEQGAFAGFQSSVVDISDRKRSETLIQRLSQALEQASTGVMITDLSGTIEYVNAAVTRTTGYASEELVGKNATILDAGDGPSVKMMEEMWRALNAGREWKGEFQNRRKDGSTYWEANAISPIRDAEGRATHYLAVKEDVTERRRALDDLLIKESAIASSPSGIALHTLDGRFTSVNHAFVKLFGYDSADDFIGRHVTEFPEFAHIAGPHFQDTLATGSWSGEVPGHLRDGRDIFYQVTASLVRNPAGEPIALLALFNDVTARKQAEERLQASEARMRLAIETTRVGVWEWHLATNKVRWDAEMFRLYGLPPNDDGVVDYSVWASALEPEELARQEASLQEMILRRGRGQREFPIRRKDSGELRHLYAVEIVRLNNAGEPEWVLGTNIDITERKQEEAQRLRAQRMESIGTLAGGIAHDLNNMLGPILLSLDYLRNKIPDDKGRRMMDVMEQSANRGADLIKQVLSFARGTSGDHTLIQIRHIVNDVRKILEQTFPKSITVNVSAPKTLPAVIADATQVHQVLMNLCVNARDAMPNGGRLTISTVNATIDDQYTRMQVNATPGRYLAVSVTDTGTGIPPEIRDRIFDPFFTTKEQGTGTGLGLATVQSIVKAHRGFLSVDSEPGKGTTFRVFLPVAEGETPTAAADTSPIPEGRQELILVVDDEQSLREITRSTLETHGYRVVDASDGASAVAAFADHKDEIALILLDMMMPVMDGPGMMRIIHRIKPSTKFLAVSGLKQGSFAGQIPEGVAFLQKPYTADLLLRKLREVLDAPGR